MRRIGQWRKGHVLGHGATATVSIATACNSGEVFAVKSVQLSCAEVLKREQSILSSLDSPFVISYLGSGVSRDSNSANQWCYNLFMELAPGGSLFDEIKKEGRLTESFIRSRTYEILSGLDYLHKNCITHRDIKCQNILIGSDGRAKIADFGCSKGEFGEEGGFQIRGTPMFMAPEVVRGEEQGKEADVWALGCVIIEMATGGVPWPGFADPVSVLHHIGSSSEAPSFPDWISEQGKDFLSKCLNRDPRERWSAQKLLNHPFVAESSENWASEKGETESWISPKSILDQEMWESLTLETPIEPLERIGSLATGEVSWPDWTIDNGENWITVRGKSENEFIAEAPTISGAQMETEELEFNPHGLELGFECCKNKGSFEGVRCKKRSNFGDYDDCFSDDLFKRRNKKLREMID
ncbi:hypothetical protein LUZ60_012686 [Juncus effusus]|nr:hypothetical protein LUZ60_012686 [Juncus effusus]